MFLKTQEGLDKLLQEYPIGIFFIKVKKGETSWISSKEEDILITITYRIQVIKNDILLINGELIDDYWVYKYDWDWIEVVSIHKSMWWARMPIPVMFNGKLIQDNLNQNNEKKIDQFYIGLEKIKIEIYRIRKQHLVIRNIVAIEKNPNVSQNYLNDLINYFQDSSAYYSAMKYRTFIDQRNDVWSIPNIIKQWIELGFDLSKEDKLRFRAFESDPIKKHVNNIIAHKNKLKYLSDDEFSIRMTTTSTGWTTYHIPMHDHLPLIRKLEDLFSFIEEIFKIYYGFYRPTSWNEDQPKFQLLLQNN